MATVQSCGMDKLAELKFINDYLVRDSKEKDRILQRCGDALRDCRCDTVTQSLLDDLARINLRITSEEYQNLFSKSSACQDDLGTPTTDDVLNVELSIPERAIKSVIFTHANDVVALPTVVTAPSTSLGTRIIEYNSEDDTATHILIEDITPGAAESQMFVSGGDGQEQVTLTTISLPGYPRCTDDLQDDDVETSTALAALQAIAEVDGKRVPVIVYQHSTDEGEIIVVAPTMSGGQESEEITVFTGDLSTEMPGHDGIATVILEEKSCEDYFETDEEKLKLTQMIQMPTDREVKEKLYECPVCEKAFLNHSTLTQHLWLHDESRLARNKCHVCGKHFPKASSLNVHIKTHTAVGVPCNICNKEFAQKSGLERHMRIHRKEKPYSCLICSRKFNQYSHAKRHMALHSNQRHKCHLCPRTFPRADLLTKHINVHKRLVRSKDCELDIEPSLEPIGCNGTIRKLKGRKTKACKYCPEKFKTKAELEAHDSTHATERPFKCDICGLRCVRKGNLITHKALHSKSASRMCEICGRTFKSTYWLGNHIKEHKGEMNFMCEKCGQGYVSQSSLSRHLVVQHGYEARRECLSCGERFSSFKELMHHRAKLHGNRYKCRICSKSFDSLGSFIRHRRCHRSGIENEEVVLESEATADIKAASPTSSNGHGVQTEDEDGEVEKLLKQVSTSGVSDISDIIKDVVSVTDRAAKKSKCPICNKLLHPSSIYKHIRYHNSSSATTTKSGKERKPCHVCNRLVSVTSQFTHMRLHVQRGETTEEPTKEDGKFRKPCNVCGKKCTPASLSRHVLSHTTRRPYSCDICQKKFTQGHHVTRHKKSQHPE